MYPISYPNTSMKIILKECAIPFDFLLYLLSNKLIKNLCSVTNQKKLFLSSTNRNLKSDQYYAEIIYVFRHILRLIFLRKMIKIPRKTILVSDKIILAPNKLRDFFINSPSYLQIFRKKKSINFYW